MDHESLMVVAEISASFSQHFLFGIFAFTTFHIYINVFKIFQFVSKAPKLTFHHQYLHLEEVQYIVLAGMHPLLVFSDVSQE